MARTPAPRDLDLVQRPIIGICALGRRWFWVCWPGQTSDRLDFATPPLACGYTREKWEAEEAAFAVAQRTGGDGQFLAARAGTAKAYHRYQVGREKAA